MLTPPTVAVIIPTYNHARFLASALTSIRAQTRPPDEIIVVDDGSTDNPSAVLADFPEVKYVRQDNRGPSAARNRGLQSTDALYVCFLDADDRFLPCAIESGLACMEQHPASGLVYGGYRLVSETGEPLGPDRFDPLADDPHREFLRRNVVDVHHTVFYRRQCLVEVGGFDETIRRGEDHDVYLRIAYKYPVVGHPGIIAEYRRHPGNTTNNHVAMLTDVLDMLDRHAARVVLDGAARDALREGKKRAREHYTYKILTASAERWRASRDTTALKDVWRAAYWAPDVVLRAAVTGFARRTRQYLSI